MGKIKSKMIKKSSKILLEKGIEFTEDFERNKEIIGNTMPSKKIKNQLAGHLTKLKKIERQNQPVLPKS